MKTKQILTIYISLLLFAVPGIAQEKRAWKMQPITIQTRWAKDVSPTHTLVEYPRPQLVRNNWSNLNGLWDYAITGHDVSKPSSYDGQILVPYPLESALSGVKKSLSPQQFLWYRRNLEMPAIRPGEKVLLNFGAVDYQATVYVNGKEIGHHTGGYTAFSFDITGALASGTNELLVKVYDPTDQGVGPHGKQVSNPKDIYYTSTSGIWQTVWTEIVPEDHIEGLVMMPDIDKGVLNLVVKGKGAVSVKVLGAGKEIAEVTSAPRNESVSHNDNDATSNENGISLVIPIENAKLWSPGSPFLYDLVVHLEKDGKVVDEVKSYFGMRKISIAKDSKGIDRIFLNNQPYYNLGTLDQGFWPEGLYTAPTDDALAFDIKAIKAMGFNTIRKHIKVEPARWYYYADRLGMLIWQDMVNPNQGLPEGAKEAFETQAKETIAQLYNHPSITTWVLFNEKWGQYDQERLTKWIKSTDPARIVNGHSGEFLYVNEQLRSPSPDAYVGADMTDVHAYPDPMMSIKEDGKAMVCGEFGGIGVFIPDHQWITGSAWGYIQEKVATLKPKYTIMAQHLQLFKEEGLSGSIYTQPFDVEGEQNGLMTYDREIIKIPFAELRRIHSKINPDVASPSWLTMTNEVKAQDADQRDPDELYSAMLQQYINGNRDLNFLKKMNMSAAQSGDKLGTSLAGNAYITNLKKPFNEEQLKTVLEFTKSTKDPGYLFMVKNKVEFQKYMGERKCRVAIMNMIMKGEIEPLLNNDTPDWNKIAEQIKPFGEPGEEILARAKTLVYFNAKDWKNFISAAEIYLGKYGNVIKQSDRELLQKAMDSHK